MKRFSHCPKCNKPMLNEIMRQVNDSNTWKLTCQSFNHDITATTLLGNDNVLETLTIAIGMAPDIQNRLYARWYFNLEELFITIGWKVADFHRPNLLPFFEPDIAQYDKLIKKMRTYVTFS